MMDVTTSLIVMHCVMLLGTVFCNQKLTLLDYSIGEPDALLGVRPI